MAQSVPLIPGEAVRSGEFLDPLRELLDAWSVRLFDDDSGGFRANERIGVNVMSSTDIPWIRYAANSTDVGAPDPGKLVRYLQNAQDPTTGRIRHDAGPAGQGHCDGHAFWQTVRALRILGAELRHFPAHLRAMMTPAGLEGWFDSLDWDSPRGGSHHEVLGLVPLVVSVNDDRLTETFFRAIGRQQDPQAGTWPRGRTNISRTFAYTAIHLAAGRLPSRPEAVVDEMLRLQDDGGLWDRDLPHFHTMDACYVLVRLPGRIGHRRADADAALRRLSRAMRHAFARAQPALLDNPHRMLAVTHTFGLLQEALPDEYPSQRPYRFDWDKLDLYGCDVISRAAGRR